MRQEVKTSEQDARLGRRKQSGARVCALLGWRTVRGEGRTRSGSSHLWGPRSEQAGFCSASAAGQQNWCSTVSFLRAEQREKVSALGRKAPPRGILPPGERRGPRRCPERTCAATDTISCSKPSHLFYLGSPVPAAGASTWMYHLFSSDFCHDHS